MNYKKLENVIFAYIYSFFQYSIFFIYIYSGSAATLISLITDRRCSWRNVIRVVTLKLFARIPGRERAVLLASLSEHVRPYQAPAFFRFGRRYL